MSINRLESLQLQIAKEVDPDIRAKLKDELGKLILKQRAVIEEEKLLEAHKVDLAIASNI